MRPGKVTPALGLFQSWNKNQEKKWERVFEARKRAQRSRYEGDCCVLEARIAQEVGGDRGGGRTLQREGQGEIMQGVVLVDGIRVPPWRRWDAFRNSKEGNNVI